MRLAVGFFDGVHLGHRAILEGADAALTFSNHPLSVLAPEKAPRLIMREADRMAAIRACGVERVFVYAFTRETASVTPGQFVERLRHDCSDLSLRCGENWRFGRGGAGGPDFLEREGIEVSVVPYAQFDGARVSSSRIREALSDGRIEDANAMLGRPHFMTCLRVPGKGVGTKMGYPTVNLDPIPPDTEGASLVGLPLGAYAVEIGGARGVANWGLAPTMGERAWRRPVLEAHILDDGEVPGQNAQEVRVDFLKFIRPEMKFESVEALKSQIARDSDAARGV